jgi:hypothetical protein
LKASKRLETAVSTPINSQSFSTSAQVAFDSILHIHQHILPRWLDVGEVVRIALTAAVASSSDRFRTSISDPSDRAPLKIVFRTDDQEPVMVIVQTILLQLCKIFEISFGIVYPSSICTSRDSRFKNEDSGFATSLHLLRSGVILLPQIQELFSDTKANSSKIDILETVAGDKAASAAVVPGTCIIGLWIENGSENIKVKSVNQVRLERMWDLQFCCKEPAKTEALIGLLDSAAFCTSEHSEIAINQFVSDTRTKFASKIEILTNQPQENSPIFAAYIKAVAMLTSAAVPAGFSIVKRECSLRHLARIRQAIQCANFEITHEGDCVLACVASSSHSEDFTHFLLRIWLIEESLASRGQT